MKSYTLRPYTFTLNFNLLFEVPSKECFKSLPTISVGRNNTRYASLRLDLSPLCCVPIHYIQISVCFPRVQCEVCAQC